MQSGMIEMWFGMPVICGKKLIHIFYQKKYYDTLVTISVWIMIIAYGFELLNGDANIGQCPTKKYLLLITFWAAFQL